MTDSLFRIPSKEIVPAGQALKVFQEEDCYRMLIDFEGRQGIYNGNPMGAGKTIETIACLNFLTAKKTLQKPRILIIGPASSIGVWHASLEDWFTNFEAMNLLIVKSGKDIIPSWAHTVLCSYDLAIPAKGKKGSVRRDGIARQLVSKDWDFLVVDEAHHLGSIDSLRSRLILGTLYEKIQKCFFLSGSITRNKIDQLWPVFRTIAPDVIPQYWHFVNRYCHVEQSNFGKKVVGAKSITDAKKLGSLALANFMVRRKKAEVLSFLPKKIEQKVYIDCPGVDMERHRTAADDFRDDIEAALEGENPPPALATAYRELGIHKIDPAIEFINGLHAEMGEDDRLVVFCYHKEVAKKIGRTVGWSITGDTSQTRRQEILKQFQAGELRTLTCTYAMSESVTLTRANYCVRVERAWSRYQNEQAEDRIHRIGQEKTTYIKDLLVRGTLDQLVYAGLKRKLTEHKGMFG